MATLHVGARCAVCPVVDFLPITCPHCSLIYCKDHIATHACTEASTSTCTAPIAGESSFAAKATCDVSACDRPSIEAIGGYEDGSIARRVRCEFCDGAFCTKHRRQDEHACPSQRDYTARGHAGEVRKRQAQEVLAKHFPGREVKEYKRPESHTREMKHHRPPSPQRLPPSVQAELAPAETAGPAAPPVGATKSKAAKLHDIQLKKLRMGAKPLILGQKPDLPRRWFELREGLMGFEGVEKWRGSGKVDGVVTKVWVHEVTPVGKVFDLVLQKGKIARPTNEDPDQSLTLLALVAEPDLDRRVVGLRLSDPMSVVPEGSTVVLIKGWKGSS